MAGRKDKNVVDYFPHQCEHGKSLFILENKYPFKGYTVWFKTLELLGKSENHFIDCRKDEDWEYLSACMKIPPDELKSIYNTCAEIGCIHKELWENRVIWSLNFLKGIADVYRRRKSKMMNFLTLIEFLSIECKHDYNKYGIYVDINAINNTDNTQSKVKESKVEERNKDNFIDVDINSKKDDIIPKEEKNPNPKEGSKKIIPPPIDPERQKWEDFAKEYNQDQIKMYPNNPERRIKYTWESVKLEIETAEQCEKELNLLFAAQDAQEKAAKEDAQYRDIPPLPSFEEWEAEVKAKRKSKNTDDVELL